MAKRKPSKKPVFAKRSLGQNFLIDRNQIAKIVDSLGDVSGDLVVEIGPGRGALTEVLVSRARKLVALELDTLLTRELKIRFGGLDHVEIIEADVLSADIASIIESGRVSETTRLIANLPYNISTPVLHKLAESRAFFSEAVLMLQREVVERITAPPGNKDRGYLTVCIEAFFTSEHLFDVPPTAFKPAPKVWSSVMRLRPSHETEIEDPKLFQKLVSAGFVQKRKTIHNNLKAFSLVKNPADLLRRSSIDPNLRPEVLGFEDWRRLAVELALDL